MEEKEKKNKIKEKLANGRERGSKGVGGKGGLKHFSFMVKHKILHLNLMQTISKKIIKISNSKQKQKKPKNLAHFSYTSLEN